MAAAQRWPRSPREYRWEHAVNARDHLQRVAAAVRRASEAHFASHPYKNAIEADIIWSEHQQTVVMGHPPQQDGDVTLQEFLHDMLSLAQLVQRDADALSSWPPFIVKLDFKTARAFEAALPVLRPFVAAFPFLRGVFINADILVGPANSSDIAFDAAAFVKTASALDEPDQEHRERVVLSLGWTTSNDTDEEIARPYTRAMIDEMLQVLKPYQHMHVTFPLRATSVRASWSVLRELLRGPPSFGFTLWWAKTQMSESELEWLYHTLEEAHEDVGMPRIADRTFYDILGFSEFLAKRQAA